MRPPGSNPGPRPFLYSKSTILAVVKSRRITAGSPFPGEPRKQGCVHLTGVSRSELARHQSVTAQRPNAEDAQVRTVRPCHEHAGEDVARLLRAVGRPRCHRTRGTHLGLRRRLEAHSMEMVEGEHSGLPSLAGNLVLPSREPRRSRPCRRGRDLARSPNRS